MTGSLVNNTPLAVSIPRAGQNARLTFSGTAGQLVGLEMTQVATVPARQALYMILLKPDGTTLVSTNSGTGDGAVLSATLPTTGTYTVFLDASYGATSSSTLVLNPPGELSIDGPPLSVSTLSGEPHTLTFVGAVGQNVGLGLTGLTHTPASGNASALYVYRPDQTLLTSANCYTSYPGGDCSLNLGTLAQAGTYWVYIVPPAGVVASATLTLSSDVTGSLVNNTPLAVSIPRAGQNARLTFSGTAGQLVGLEMTQVATVPARQALYMILLKPDGTTLVSTNSGTGDGAVLSATLPTTGTYTVFLDASYGATSSSTLVLNPPGELSIDGPPLSVSTLSGEPHTLTFVGAVGQNVGLGLTGLTHTPASGNASALYVYRPDQTLLTSANCYTSYPGGDCPLNLGTLAQAGTYWVYIVPPAGVVASATLTLSSDVTGTLVNNTPLAVSIPRAGQNARLTFSGTAGQPVGLEMTQVATVPARQAVYMFVLKPDGTTLVSTNSGTGDGAVLSATLPTTGTYTVFLDASFGATSSSTLVLNPPGELTIDGPPLNVSTLSGEPHTLTFVGAVGQNLGLGLTGLTHTPASGNGMRSTCTGPTRRC